MAQVVRLKGNAPVHLFGPFFAMPSESVKDVALLTLNVCSTIGIVLANKFVLTVFPYAMTLTFCHQVVAGVLLMGRRCSFQPEKPLPLWADMWFSFLAILCIYVQNISLRINTVTLYQVAKLLNIPTQCVWQYLTKGKVFSIYVYGALVILTLGVALSTIAELNFEATAGGVMAAGLAVIVVVIEQAEIGRLKEKYQVNSMDFLHSNSLHRICMSGVLIFCVERQALIQVQEMTLGQGGMLFASCLFATSINITVVAVIGKFGAVATAVVGHLKTISIVVLGFLIHPPPINMTLAKNLIGVTVALGGAVKYGQYTAFPEADCFARCRPKSAEENGEEEQSRKANNPSCARQFPLVAAAMLFAITLSVAVFMWFDLGGVGGDLLARYYGSAPNAVMEPPAAQAAGGSGS